MSVEGRKRSDLNDQSASPGEISESGLSTSNSYCPLVIQRLFQYSQQKWTTFSSRMNVVRKRCIVSFKRAQQGSLIGLPM
ncbi:hypothetical protein, partial [Candidatus Similichlamydia epinepheli]|uniref:hypothetical protein n=1 Tax=Candidatus Similichlamydia epinepheli TaxID=1903953 RepID=UPI00130055F1